MLFLILFETVPCFREKIRAFSSQTMIKLCTTTFSGNQIFYLTTGSLDQLSLAALWMFVRQNWSWEPLVKKISLNFLVN